MDRTSNLVLAYLLVIAAAFFSLVHPQPARAEGPAATYTVVRNVLRPASPNGIATDELSQQTSDFVVNGNLWSPSSVPVSVRYNRQDEAPGVTGVQNIIQDSISTWNAVTPTTFTFAYDRETAGQPGSCDSEIPLDGINAVKFAPIAGDALGVTCAVFLEVPPARSSWNSTWCSRTHRGCGPLRRKRQRTDSTCLQPSFRELGHSAGLGHSSDLESAMNPILSIGTQRRNLNGNDIAGLKTAYPPASVSSASAPVSSATSEIVRGNFQLRIALVAVD